MRWPERLAADGVGGHTDEDIHSLVERLLHDEIGEVACKLHTGRSRNDQVVTDLRLWGMEAARVLDDALSAVLGGLVSLAGRSVDLIMPGYTHLQQAQPVRAAHWALSHFWPLMRTVIVFAPAGLRGVGGVPLSHRSGSAPGRSRV